MRENLLFAWHSQRTHVRIRWVGPLSAPLAWKHDRFVQGDVYRFWMGGLLFVVRRAKR